MGESASEASEVSVPGVVSKLRLFDRVDAQDAYSVETSIERTPEQWMRAIIEGAPRWFRVAWPAVLGTLAGLDFGPRSAPDHVLGWNIVHDRPDVFVVGLESSRGLVVRLATVAPAGRAVFATQLRLETAYARGLWTVARPAHRYFAPRLLARATSMAINPDRSGPARPSGARGASLPPSQPHRRPSRPGPTREHP